MFSNLINKLLVTKKLKISCQAFSRHVFFIIFKHLINIFLKTRIPILI